jgi:hypothetical protein
VFCKSLKFVELFQSSNFGACRAEKPAFVTQPAEDSQPSSRFRCYADERGNKVSGDDANRTATVSSVEARQGLLSLPVLMGL